MSRHQRFDESEVKLRLHLVERKSEIHDLKLWYTLHTYCLRSIASLYLFRISSLEWKTIQNNVNSFSDINVNFDGIIIMFGQKSWLNSGSTQKHIFYIKYNFFLYSVLLGIWSVCLCCGFLVWVVIGEWQLRVITDPSLVFRDVVITDMCWIWTSRLDTLDAEGRKRGAWQKWRQ